LPQTRTFGSELVLQDRQGGAIAFGANHPAYHNQFQRARSSQSDGPVYGYLHSAPDWDPFLDRETDTGTAHIESQTGSSSLAVPEIECPVLNPLLNWKSVGLALFLKFGATGSRRLHLADPTVAIARVWNSAGNDE
jgi:hypothetical protein